MRPKSLGEEYRCKHVSDGTHKKELLPTMGRVRLPVASQKEKLVKLDYIKLWEYQVE